MKIFSRSSDSRKTHLLLPFLLLVVFSLLLLSADTSPKKTKPVSLSQKDMQAIVTVSFGEGYGTRSFTGEVFDGMTLADALTVAGRTGNFDVTFTDDGRPVTLNGGSGPWLVEHNGRLLDASLFATAVVPGDKVLVRAVNGR